ncbi:MAG: hypothetical protein ACRDD8_10195 [Bacteroidales bacterium]|uniref:hypothetical protein n=1 Tax=Clostridium sp. TaxID=1506 RepID=UPI003EE4377B
MEEELELICFTREEMCDLLNTNNDGFKYIVKSNKLNSRLQLVGFKFIKNEKIGRNKVYYLTQIPIDEWSVLQNYYKIRDKQKEQHTEYSYEKVVHPSKSKKKIMKEVNMEYNDTNRKRATKYDKILEAEEAIKRVGYDYLMYNKEADEYTLIEEWEYKDFWDRNKMARDLKSKYIMELNKNIISQSQYDRLIYDIENKILTFGGEIAVKVVKYEEFKNQLKIIEMIGKHLELKK